MRDQSPPLDFHRSAKKNLQKTLLAAIQDFERTTQLHVSDIRLTSCATIDRPAPETTWLELEVRL